MELGPPLPIDAQLKALALANDFAGAKPASLATTEFRKTIADYLAVAELVTLDTVGAHGWPFVHCMHFAAYFVEGNRPVVYMFTHENKRKLANIAANPRVAMTIFNPRSEAHEGPYLQMRGVARILSEEDERLRAMHGQFNKPGYGFARQLGLETQPAIRVDVTGAVWTPGPGEPPVAIDYRPFLEMAS